MFVSYEFFLLIAGYSLSVLNMNNSIKFIVQQGSGTEDRKNDFLKNGCLYNYNFYT